MRTGHRLESDNESDKGDSHTVGPVIICGGLMMWVLQGITMTFLICISIYILIAYKMNKINAVVSNVVRRSLV